MKGGTRLLQILRVVLRYRLDTLLDETRLARRLRLLRPFVPVRGDVANQPRGERLRLALQELGPLFVKFGQVLSTRRDLLAPDIADALAQLQDRVAPFPGEQAEAIVVEALGRPLTQLYRNFERTPLASASVAQVHAAQLPDGRAVVVKVLRPGVEQRIEQDLSLLRAFARLAEKIGPDPEMTRPQEIVAELQRSLRGELDLQREGANASLMRRNFDGSPDLYVPQVFWDCSCERVLTMERVSGVRADDVAALDAARVDRTQLAATGVRLFYTQVFRDNFFHADAHPGNLWIDIAYPQRPRYIALDFGIVGSLPEVDRYYLAENFTAIFERNYRRIAELHIEAGWMPATLRLDALEADVRTICEPHFTRPLAEIALGEVLFKLFKLARANQLTIQPQLILLQKTLLNIEGIGRTLDPKLDIWVVAQPVLADILQRERSPGALLARLRERAPGWLLGAPEIPQMLHDYLRKAVTGQVHLRMQSDDLAELAATSRAAQRQTVLALLGATLAVCSVLLYAFHIGGHEWLGLPLTVWIAGVGALVAFVMAWPRKALR
ncbi:MAG: ubiquinone biosynthesis regulatory protein kinase UbiB [Proteobacteria bacterium]|nr:ubiquinone biosynthesis regulatory protein kinase UbiB [Pseudomonadota bacterium]MBS0464225.1 ubiquinone biosynthesis regulatory protein kinase UbiB [Pseudomonadota bacterium]